MQLPKIKFSPNFSRRLEPNIAELDAYLLQECIAEMQSTAALNTGCETNKGKTGTAVYSKKPVIFSA